MIEGPDVADMGKKVRIKKDQEKRGMADECMGKHVLITSVLLITGIIKAWKRVGKRSP